MKPREFWIEHKMFVDEWIYEAFVSDEIRVNRDIVPIHVIEYTAYEDAQKAFKTEISKRTAFEFELRESLEATLSRVTNCMGMITKLTEQNKIMREALNFYAAGENIYMNPMGLTEGKRGPRFGTRAKEALAKCGGTEPMIHRDEIKALKHEIIYWRSALCESIPNDKYQEYLSVSPGTTAKGDE